MRPTVDCRAEPVVAALMADHAGLVGRVHRILGCLDNGNTTLAGALTRELAASFAHHVAMEEAGLFTQMRKCTTAAARIDRLIGDDRRVIARLSHPASLVEPERLRQALAELVDHIGSEDADLFPLALSALPAKCWDVVEDVHQRYLTL
jgi:hypothetical protein